MFSVQCRFMSNKEKGDISFFSHSKCREVDQWDIGRLSSFGLTSIIVNVFLSNAVSLRIRKKETFPFFLFPYSKCIGVDQWYISRLSSFGLTIIMVYVFFVQCRFIANKEKGDISFFLIRNAWS